MKRWLIIVTMLAASAATSAAELGRLFLTPAERTALDQVRYAVPVAQAETAPGVSVHEAAGGAIPRPLTTPITVNGYVARSAGQPTMWINGADVGGGDLSELGIDAQGVRLEAARVRVPLESSTEPVALKPGQSFDPNSGQVSDAYERRPPP